MKAAIFSWIFLSLIILSVAPVHADTLKMKDGSVREGEIMADDNTVVFLKSGTVVEAIVKSEVDSIERSRIPAAVIRQEQKVTGKPAEQIKAEIDARFAEAEQIMRDRARMEADHEKAKELRKTYEPLIPALRNNPAFRWAFNLSYEVQAKTRVQKLASVTALYLMERGDGPVSIGRLVSEGKIEAEFDGERYDDYWYSIVFDRGAYQIKAVPADATLGMKSFVYDSGTNRISDM